MKKLASIFLFAVLMVIALGFSQAVMADGGLPLCSEVCGHDSDGGCSMSIKCVCDESINAPSHFCAQYLLGVCGESHDCIID